MTTFITYIGYGLIIGAVSVPNASGNEEEYNAWLYGNYSGVPLFTDCSADAAAMRHTGNNETFVCEFGSANDQQVRTSFQIKRITLPNQSNFTHVVWKLFYVEI